MVLCAIFVRMKRLLFCSSVSPTLVMALLLSIVQPAAAQSFTKRGVYGFLQLPASAEVAALGGRTVSYISQNPAMVFSNPGLFGQEMRGKLSLLS